MRPSMTGKASRRTMRRFERGAAAIAAFLIAAAAAAAEAEPLAVESAGIFPIDTESRLTVRDLAGEITMRASTARELRFVSNDLAHPDQGLPVGVYVEGNLLTLKAPESSRGTARSLSLEVPSSMAVTIEGSGLTIEAGELDAGLDVRGSHLRVAIDGVVSTVRIEATESRIDLKSVGADAAVRGRELDVSADSVSGDLVLALTASKAVLRQVGGTLDAELEGTSLETGLVTGAARIAMRGGQGKLGGLKGGGTLDLQKAPVTLIEAAGEFDVETDADFLFRDSSAALHVVQRGGSVRGTNQKALVEVKSDGGPVVLEGIYGPLRIQGDNLEVSLKDLSQETLVYTRDSHVVVDTASADVTVEAERAAVQVDHVLGRVAVTSKNGDVSIGYLNGSAAVDADGGQVTVGWLTLPGTKNSTVKNASGGVTVRFASSATCKVVARTRIGRIESSLPGVVVTDGAGEAQGSVGNAMSPTVTVEANGDVHLESADAPAP